MSLVTLPVKRSVAPEFDKISKLGIVAHQGVGKTSTCASLPNSLVIDFEDGCKEHYEAMSVNLKRIVAEKNISLGQAYNETIKAIKVANAAKGSPIYDFIIFDGVTAMEKLAHQLATRMFKMSIVGKGMVNKGAIINDVVTDVPESGWLWFFRAWEDLYGDTLGLSKISNIYLAHAKQSSLVKQGIKLDANDLALTGKAKTSFLRDIDACGMLYREGSKTILSFKTDEKDLTIKSRARHLNEQNIVIAEMIDNKLITYWDKVFFELKK